MAVGMPAVSLITHLAGATGGTIVLVIVGAVRDRRGRGENTRQMAVRFVIRMAMDPTTVPM
jgi:hypothetical protein